MSFDEEKDEVKGLYEQFRKNLLEHCSNNMFDRQDLIDIYDYANDFHDDFVRMEVLILASQLYPQSREIIQRKACLYSDLGITEGSQIVISQLPPGSFVRQLLDIKHRALTGPIDVTSELDKLIEHRKPGSIDDEQMFCLFDIVVELDCQEWLKDNFERLKQLSEYKETILSEMAEVAEDSHDVNFSRDILEELTEECPFDGRYWEMLAYVYLNNLDDPVKALNALEFARAINPDSRNAYVMYLQALLKTDETEESFLKVLNEFVSKYPDDPFACATQAHLLAANGKSFEAICKLEDYLDKHALDEMIVDFLIRTAIDFDLPEALERLYMNHSINPDDWIGNAKSLYALGLYKGVVMMLEAMGNSQQLKDHATIYIESLFQIGKFERLVDFVYDWKDDNPLAGGGSPETWFLLFAIALKKLGQTTQLQILLNQLKASLKIWMEQANPSVRQEIRLSLRGLMCYYDALEKSITDNSIPEAAYNPLCEI